MTTSRPESCPHHRRCARREFEPAAARHRIRENTQAQSLGARHFPHSRCARERVHALPLTAVRRPASLIVEHALRRRAPTPAGNASSASFALPTFTSSAQAEPSTAAILDACAMRRLPLGATPAATPDRVP